MDGVIGDRDRDDAVLWFGAIDRDKEIRDCDCDLD